MISEGEIKDPKMSSFSSDFQCLYELLMSLRRLLEDGRSKKEQLLKGIRQKMSFSAQHQVPTKTTSASWSQADKTRLLR